MVITENLILSACAGKVVFETHGHAQKAMRKNERGYTPYHCKVCGKWHLGGNINGRWRKLQRKLFNKKKEKIHD